MRIEKNHPASNETYKGKHRFEHWYVDNQVYFVTARCRDKYPAFSTEPTKQIFWDRFDHYTNEFGFTPWVTSLMENHYHTLGYLRIGSDLAGMMQRIHGSVAKLVNDLLDSRLKPFWRDTLNKDYFDGCIRDERQCRRAYRYTLTQCARHGICSDWHNYPHTHVNVQLDRGLARALELKAFLDGVPYKRYQRKPHTGA
jgi:REP element-mobilizing transposase RayT